MNFGEKIKLLRTDSEFSQEYLADLLDVSWQSIVNWENNKETPNAEDLEKISFLFGVTVDSLVRDDDGTEISNHIFYWNYAITGGGIGILLSIFSNRINLVLGGFLCGGIGFLIAVLIKKFERK